jgi:hypothetical protein
VQFETHAVFAVGLVVGVTLLGVTCGDVTGMPGTRQLLWQLAEEALQVIMQFVTADEMPDDDAGGADVDGTLDVGTCAKTPTGAAALIVAANRNST